MGDTEFAVARSDDELYHHGILGMKWGVRRFQAKDGGLTNLGRKRYSDKDGSLNKRGKKKYEQETAELKAEKKLLKNKARTQKKMDKLKDLKNEVDDLKEADEEAKKGESREEKRKRLLESTDAKEIYENRNLLSTAELNDRIYRIDTEARLASKIPQEKTGLDYVNDRMNRASNTLNNATNMFNKVDNAYSTVTKSGIGKVLAKKLGIETPKKEWDAEKLWEDRNKMSNEEFSAFTKRLVNESLASSKMDDYTKRKNAAASEAKTKDILEKAQKQVDDYNKNWYENDSSRNSSYSMKGDQVVDRKTGTGSKSGSNPRLEEPREVFTGTVEGEGTSRFRGFGNDYVDNNPTWRDVSTKSSEYSEVAKVGMNYIAGYLPYDDKKK